MEIVSDNQSPDPADAAVESDLIDLTGLGLEDLRVLSETAVTKSLRRICAEMESRQDPVAGFQSSLP